jgi:hypothetical protein
MTISKAINYIAYASNINAAPNGVNQLRWNGIVKFIKKNYAWDINQSSLDTLH